MRRTFPARHMSRRAVGRTEDAGGRFREDRGRRGETGFSPARGSGEHQAFPGIVGVVFGEGGRVIDIVPVVPEEGVLDLNYGAELVPERGEPGLVDGYRRRNLGQFCMQYCLAMRIPVHYQ